MLTKLLPLLLIPSLTFAAPKEVPVETVLVYDGFVLSTYMQDELECDKIYTEEIPLFLKMNPDVKDPDVIRSGQSVRMRICNYLKKEKENKIVTAIDVETNKDVSSVIKEKDENTSGYERRIGLYISFENFVSDDHQYSERLSVPGLRYDGTYHFNRSISLGLDANLSRTSLIAQPYLEFKKDQFFIKPYLGYNIGLIDQLEKNYSYSMLGVGRYWEDDSDQWITEILVNFTKDSTNIGFNIERDVMFFQYYLRYLVMRDYNYQNQVTEDNKQMIQIGIGIRY